MAITKRKRMVLNVAMVVLAALVVAAGVTFFVAVRGGQGASSPLVVSSKVGNANIERAGINYALDEGTTLQAGDLVETLDGSEVGIKGPGETALFIADASKLKVNFLDESSSKVVLGPESGCFFSDARVVDGSLELEGAGLAWSAGDAVFVSDVRTGSSTIQVLSGEVACGDGVVVEAGESRTVLSDAGQGKAAGEAGKLTLGSLDSFALEHALDAVKAGRELVFSEEQISGELDRRESERTELAEQASIGVGGDASGEVVSGDSADSGDGGAANGGSASGAATNTAEGGDEDEKHTCTIQIRCDTILNNMGSLAEGKSKYVPKTGRILGSVSVSFDEGESAFDVLKRVCKAKGIALEYSYAPVYGSYYVEGIGNLYQFDCGDESGWMYKVNGWFPNYGCSEYKLSDGDAIVFCYTCRGLGEDVGA